MARITVEDCLEKVDNQYDLVLLAKERTVQLNAGSPMLVEEDNDKRTIISLREIGDGKIEVKDITKTRDEESGPHAQNDLDVHDPNAYFNFLKKTRKDINKVSPSFCAAKWTQSTILLYNGETHSCHHPSRHKIQLSDIKNNPKGLHNTEHKMKAREEMLQGIQTKECDYCWRVENQNPEHISDRVYKSSYSWSLPHIPKIEASGRGEDFDPTYVEVAFDSTCNFKCIYCSPEASSRWEDEIRKHGDMKQTEFNLNNLDWLKSEGKLPIHHKENNPYKYIFKDPQKYLQK